MTTAAAKIRNCKTVRRHRERLMAGLRVVRIELGHEVFEALLARGELTGEDLADPHLLAQTLGEIVERELIKFL